MFNKENTLFRFECDVELAIEDKDYKNFIFPNNTYIYIIDDSKIQRRMMKRQLELIQKDGINIIVLGNGEEEITNIYNYLFESITNNKDAKHIIICDENLDYKINGCAVNQARLFVEN